MNDAHLWEEARQLKKDARDTIKRQISSTASQTCSTADLDKRELRLEQACKAVLDGLNYQGQSEVSAALDELECCIEDYRLALSR